MRALVTGGAGFIGSHLVEHLVARQYHVTVLDNFSTGFYNNLATCHNAITLVDGDICDTAAVANALQGVDVVFHLAGKISVHESFQHVDAYMDVNVTATQQLLAQAAQAGVQQFIFSSSCSVYGDAGLPAIEETVPLQPKSPYATSKQIGEALLNTYAMATPMRTIALRYFNVYGPRQADDSDYASVMQRFIAMRLCGQPATIYGTGEQARDFIYVTDVARANLMVAEHYQKHPLDGSSSAGRLEVFNVGTGQAISVNQLHEVIAQQFSDSALLSPQYQPQRQGDVMHSNACIQKLTHTVGFKPYVSLEEGIAQLIAAKRQPQATLA